MLRVLEQDGLGQIALAIGASFARKGRKRLYGYGLLRKRVQ